MRHLVVFIALLGLASTAVSAEQLPDQAVLQTSSPQQGPGTSLSGDEMASLYLQSPTLVSNAETQNGIDAVNDRKRYANTNLVERDRFSREQLSHTTMAPPKPEPAANPLLLLPLLQQLKPQY